MLFSRLLFARQMIICMLVLLSIASSAYGSSEGEHVLKNPSYHINPGDVLQVFVWNEDALTREVLVQPDGKFSFPLVGVINATDVTVTQLEEKIVLGLQRYLQDKPVVTVTVVHVNGNSVYVIGQVNRPGKFILESQMSVIQALALAGGLTPFAEEKNIRVLRKNPNGKDVSYRFRYDKVKLGEALMSNIILISGDVVVVP